MDNQKKLVNPLKENNIKLEPIDEVLLKFIYSLSYSNNQLITEKYFIPFEMSKSLLNSGIKLKPETIENRLLSMTNSSYLYCFKMANIINNKIQKINVFTLNPDFKNIINKIEEKIIYDFICKLYNVFQETFEKEFLLILEENSQEIQTILQNYVSNKKLIKLNLNIQGNPVNILFPDFHNENIINYKQLTTNMLLEIVKILSENKISENDISKIVKTKFYIPTKTSLENPFSNIEVKEFILNIYTFSSFFKNEPKLSILSSICLALFTKFQDENINKIDNKNNLEYKIKNILSQEVYQNGFILINKKLLLEIEEKLNYENYLNEKDFTEILKKINEIEIVKFKEHYYFISHKSLKDYYLNNYNDKKKMEIFIELFRNLRESLYEQYKFKWFDKLYEKFKDNFEPKRLKRICNLIDYKPYYEKLKQLGFFKRLIAMIVLLIFPETKTIFGISLEDEWENLIKEELKYIKSTEKNFKNDNEESNTKKLNKEEGQILIEFINNIIALKPIYNKNELEKEIKSLLRNLDYQKLIEKHWNNNITELIDEQSLFISVYCQSNVGKRNIYETFYFLNPKNFIKLKPEYFQKTREYILKKMKDGNFNEKLLYPQLYDRFEEIVNKFKLIRK